MPQPETRAPMLRGPEWSIQIGPLALEAGMLHLRAPLRDDHGPDLEALKRALTEELGIQPRKLEPAKSYADCLKILLTRLREHLESGASALPDVRSLHSIALQIHQNHLVLNAVFHGPADGCLEELLRENGPVIDLLLRHCKGYPGPDPSPDPAPERRQRSHAALRAWLPNILVDPELEGSLLFVRSANLLVDLPHVVPLP